MKIASTLAEIHFINIKEYDKWTNNNIIEKFLTASESLLKKKYEDL